MLDVAISKARELPYIQGQNRVFSIAVDKKGKVVSEGANSYIKTHPKQAKFAWLAGLSDKVYLHAEVATIIKAKYRRIHKLYIARVDAQGEPCLALPCPVCSLAIKESNIFLVEYTK